MDEVQALNTGTIVHPKEAEILKNVKFTKLRSDTTKVKLFNTLCLHTSMVEANFEFRTAKSFKDKPNSLLKNAVA